MCLSCRVAWWVGHMREFCVACVLCDPGVPPRGVIRACVWRASVCGLAIVVYLGFAKVL